MILLALFFVPAVAVLLWAGFWIAVTKIVESSEAQQSFLKGGLPFEPPNGPYRGTPCCLDRKQDLWQGKSFDATNRVGIDVFTPRGASLLKRLNPSYKLFQKNTEGNTEAYFFNTSTGLGIKDSEMKVFKLDYDLPENPFIVRLFLEEVVETAPEQFLGKVHIKVFPGYYATTGFFNLRKPAAGQITE